LHCLIVVTDHFSRPRTIFRWIGRVPDRTTAGSQRGRIDASESVTYLIGMNIVLIIVFGILWAAVLAAYFGIMPMVTINLWNDSAHF
jgi:hypothetical protein